MTKKRSKHPRYDDPTAFSKRFPRIKPVLDRSTLMSYVQDTNVYKMGKITAAVTPPQDMNGYFMSIHGKDTYPTWDEIVWLRYNLIPDAAVMSLVLPNLNSYINQEDTRYKFTFTMEQKGWALDAVPVCSICGNPLEMRSMNGTYGDFECAKPCELGRTIDMSAWNEKHGNGKLVKNG